jgi:hypothetical protein
VDEAPEKFPPEEWFAAVAEGRPQRVAFRDVNGDTEFVRAEWLKENVFYLRESPLLVDGISIRDFVEVEWTGGGIDPRFVRVADERWRCRTIRAHATPKEVKYFKAVCQDYHIAVFEPPRYERGIFVTAIEPDEFKEYLESEEVEDEELLYYFRHALPNGWVFTDTGSQDL